MLQITGYKGFLDSLPENHKNGFSETIKMDFEDHKKT